jgi:hypothetical protein
MKRKKRRRRRRRSLQVGQTWSLDGYFRRTSKLEVLAIQ